MIDRPFQIGAVGEVLERAKQAAIDYYRLTGKPLGITGEVGEYTATRLLELTLADARAPGYDAIDAHGRRYQIKTRALSQSARQRSQRVGSIRLDHEWDSVLLVLLDEKLEPREIWEANRQSAAEGLWCMDLRISISGSASVFESLSCLSSSTHRVATISPEPSTGS